MKEEMRKETKITDSHFEIFVEHMKVNKMYELPANPHFKWAMIEHNEYGYCWTIGYKGMCTTLYSTDNENNIKYWSKELEAKADLIKKICAES